jgi:hypothetical protein
MILVGDERQCEHVESLLYDPPERLPSQGKRSPDGRRKMSRWLRERSIPLPQDYLVGHIFPPGPLWLVTPVLRQNVIRFQNASPGSHVT